jgi:DNA polymerase III epsilon subunit-like protein
MTRCVYINVQSTGVTKDDKVCQISLLEVTDEKITGRKDFNVDPGREFSPKATELTGKTWADYKGEKSFSKIAKGIADFLQESDYVITHMKSFHISMLDREFKQCGLPAVGTYCDNKILDLYTRGIKYFSKSNDNSLEGLCEQLKKFHYQLRSGQYHSAKKVDNLLAVTQAMATSQDMSFDGLLKAGTEKKLKPPKKTKRTKMLASDSPLLSAAKKGAKDELPKLKRRDAIVPGSKEEEAIKSIMKP